MRVGRQGVALAGLLLPEAVQVLLGQPAFQEGAGVHAGGGVALEEDLVAAAGVVLAAEEVVEAHLVQRGRAGVGGDVPADADVRALGAVHHAWPRSSASRRGSGARSPRRRGTPVPGPPEWCSRSRWWSPSARQRSAHLRAAGGSGQCTGPVRCPGNPPGRRRTQSIRRFHRDRDPTAGLSARSGCARYLLLRSRPTSHTCRLCLRFTWHSDPAQGPAGRIFFTATLTVHRITTQPKPRMPVITTTARGHRRRAPPLRPAKAGRTEADAPRPSRAHRRRTCSVSPLKEGHAVTKFRTVLRVA